MDLDIQTLVLSSALALSLHERGLTSFKLNVKGFAPGEEYCNELLQRLEAKRIITIADGHGSIVGAQTQDKLNEFISNNAIQIKRALHESSDKLADLRAFRREVTICECIEYSRFYSEQWGVELTDVNRTDPKLALLALELQGEQINTLLWRSIKVRSGNETAVNFNEITQDALDTFIRYSRRGLTIDCYKRPSALRSSKLADLLDLYLLNHNLKSEAID